MVSKQLRSFQPDITDEVQGYVGTVTSRGKVQFVKFGGGLTAKYEQAHVFQTPEEAITIARERAPATIYAVPGYRAIGADGELA